MLPSPLAAADAEFVNRAMSIETFVCEMLACVSKLRQACQSRCYNFSVPTKTCGVSS